MCGNNLQLSGYFHDQEHSWTHCVRRVRGDTVAASAGSSRSTPLGGIQLGGTDAYSELVEML
jgi:hypothetical protein